VVIESRDAGEPTLSFDVTDDDERRNDEPDERLAEVLRRRAEHEARVAMARERWRRRQEEAQAERDRRQARHRELLDRQLAALRGSVDDAAPPPLPELPEGTNLYKRGRIKKAVKSLAKEATRKEVAAKTKLSPDDATRVSKLWDGLLLDLDDQGKLVVSARVAQVSGRIGLLYLDERGERWLNPADDRPAPARGGRR
jgi:hypothetical protein